MRNSKPPHSNRSLEEKGRDRPVKINILVSPQLRRRKPPEPDQWDDDELEEDSNLEGLGDRASINVLVSSRSQRSHFILSALLSLGILLGTASLVAGGGWLAVKLIVNPGSVGWLRWILPEWNDRPLSQKDLPLTLTELRSEAAEAKLFLGNPLPLGNGDDLLIPVFNSLDQCSGTGNVANSCRQLIELRVYRPQTHQPLQQEPLLQIVDRFAVAGPQEFFVIGPLSASLGQGSSRSQPLDKISLTEGNAPKLGVWFQLSGEWNRGSTRIAYGQLMHYTSAQGRLTRVLEWTSPAGQIPNWKEITGGGSAELVVNQTVGLEPQFQVYQVKSNPLHLEPISLSKAALDSQTYENGLILARQGLWSPALRLMQSAKRRTRSKNWSLAAQAQLDLIALHADYTQKQVGQTWASPSQQITAQLIDGQWDAALRSLQSAIRESHDMTSLLEDDSGHLWEQVGAALSVNPAQPAVQAWGALILATRQGRTAALAWLQQQQPQTTLDPNVPLDSRIQQVVNLLDSLSNADASDHPSRLMGAVSQLSSIHASEWLRPQPNTPLTLGDQQTWYQIQVASFQDGQRWRRSPFTDLNLPSLGLAQQLWDLLGLTNDPQIQIITWTPEASLPIQATVKAVQFRGGILRLLAVGETPPGDSFSVSHRSPRPLGMTAAALHWIDPSTFTLGDLNQQQPALVSRLLPILWRELQQTRQVPSSLSSSEVMLQEVSQWSVQQVDLTGNHQPETILTFQPSLLATSHDVAANSQASRESELRRLIFSDQGTLLYSDLQGGERSMVAIADLDDGGPPVLIINSPQNYSFRQWSAQNHRFE